jgi:hypothetical protein
MAPSKKMRSVEVGADFGRKDFNAISGAITLGMTTLSTYS